MIQKKTIALLITGLALPLMDDVEHAFAKT